MKRHDIDLRTRKIHSPVSHLYYSYANLLTNTALKNRRLVTAEQPNLRNSWLKLETLEELPIILEKSIKYT